MREAVSMALSGKTPHGAVADRSLISNFEILNLVPTSNKVDVQQQRQQSDSKKPPTIMPQKPENPESTKWRRVGLVLGRKVHLDTIVW